MSDQRYAAEAANRASIIMKETFDELKSALSVGSGRMFPNGVGKVSLDLSIGIDDGGFHLNFDVTDVGATSLATDSSWKLSTAARSPAERIREAKRLLVEGKTYPLGCSGFICAVLGIAHEQANELIGDDATYVGECPPYSGLTPGDIVGWRSEAGSGHVALFVGEDTKSYFIDVREPGAKPRSKNAYYDHKLYRSGRFEAE